MFGKLKQFKQQAASSMASGQPFAGMAAKGAGPIAPGLEGPMPGPAQAQKPMASPAMNRARMGAATPMKKGGSISSASKRADGIATKGKTKGKMIAMCGGGMYKGK